MKKKIKLSELEISSFTTKLDKDRRQTVRGGDEITDLCVSDRFNMCFSHNMGTCDCTVNPCSIDPREC